MTNAPISTENSKKQSDQNATKNFDYMYTTIADRFRTASWSNDSHKTGVVKLKVVYGIPTSPLTTKSCVIKMAHIKKFVNPAYNRDRGTNANPSGEVIKMQHTSIFSNKNIVSKIYSDTSLNMPCYAQSVYELRSRAEGVSTNNQRGRGPGPCLI